MLVVPLMWPAVLPVVAAAPMVAKLVVRKPEVRVEPRKPIVVQVADASAIHAPSERVSTVTTAKGGGMISRVAFPSAGESLPEVALGGGMRPEIMLGTGLGNDPGSRVVVAAAAATTGPVRVSSGVSAGMLLAPIRPVYPAIAKASHVEGMVTVTATIDKAGRIVGLQVLSGPAMLRGAAVEAVEAARYKPFQLNGSATEVVTTISVVFRMQG